MTSLVQDATRLTAPVAGEFARIDSAFDPVTWANLLAIAASAREGRLIDIHPAA